MHRSVLANTWKSTPDKHQILHGTSCQLSPTTWSKCGVKRVKGSSGGGLSGKFGQGQQPICVRHIWTGGCLLPEVTSHQLSAQKEPTGVHLLDLPTDLCYPTATWSKYGRGLETVSACQAGLAT
jgi:hypothetical protein